LVATFYLWVEKKTMPNYAIFNPIVVI